MSNTRRQFLAALGAATAMGGQAWEPGRADAAPSPDLPRESPPAANLGALFPQVEELAGTAEYEFSFLQKRFTDLEAFKREARAKVQEAFAYQPQAVALRPEIVDRADQGDYIREKAVFSTSDVFRVPAYVLIPKKRSGPAPAIIDLHSHGGMFLFGKEKVIDFGDNHPAMVEYHQRNYDGRPTATEFVRRGYVVISIDALMFGERRILLESDAAAGWDRSRYTLDDVRRLNQQCRGKESTIVKGLTLAGATWPGIVTWDDRRTIDYLLTRPEVDPRRIGCVGVSLGGHRSLYLAGMDERIAAACVAGFMSTVRPMIRAHLDTHSFVHFVPHLHRWLDMPDVVSLMAPKPLLLQQCSQDGLFPLAGMKAAIDKIAAVYQKAGASAQFQGRFYDIPHRFSLAMQDDAIAFFDRHLKR